jgi:thiamine-phosphate pyrophosphorylase
MPRWDPQEVRELLARAHLYLIWTPAACGGRDALAVLEAVLPHVDLIQVRPKAPDAELDPLRPGGATSTTSAREACDWTARVLDLLLAHHQRRIPAIVNDRVDAARSLLERGCAGVHLGQDDCPPRVARAVLGEDALIGFSTHSAAQVARAGEEPVDYLGFGPVRATATKGYTRGLGAEACWVAHHAARVPVFPIGGIDRTSVDQLAGISRAAVGSAILAAEDPASAAATLRGLLLATE